MNTYPTIEAAVEAVALAAGSNPKARGKISAPHSPRAHGHFSDTVHFMNNGVEVLATAHYEVTPDEDDVGYQGGVELEAVCIGVMDVEPKLSKEQRAYVVDQCADNHEGQL